MESSQRPVSGTEGEEASALERRTSEWFRLAVSMVGRALEATHYGNRE